MSDFMLMSAILSRGDLGPAEKVQLVALLKLEMQAQQARRDVEADELEGRQSLRKAEHDASSERRDLREGGEECAAGTDTEQEKGLDDEEGVPSTEGRRDPLEEVGDGDRHQDPTSAGMMRDDEAGIRLSTDCRRTTTMELPGGGHGSDIYHHQHHQETGNDFQVNENDDNHDDAALEQVTESMNEEQEGEDEVDYSRQEHGEAGDENLPKDSPAPSSRNSTTFLDQIVDSITPRPIAERHEPSTEEQQHLLMTSLLKLVKQLSPVAIDDIAVKLGFDVEALKEQMEEMEDKELADMNARALGGKPRSAEEIVEQWSKFSGGFHEIVLQVTLFMGYRSFLHSLLRRMYTNSNGCQVEATTETELAFRVVSSVYLAEKAMSIELCSGLGEETKDIVGVLQDWQPFVASFQQQQGRGSTSRPLCELIGVRELHRKRTGNAECRAFFFASSSKIKTEEDQQLVEIAKLMGITIVRPSELEDFLSRRIESVLNLEDQLLEEVDGPLEALETLGDAAREMRSRMVLTNDDDDEEEEEKGEGEGDVTSCQTQELAVLDTFSAGVFRHTEDKVD